MKSVRVHGGGLDKYDNIRVGINGRLDTIQAAILLEKFDIFKKDEIALRNKVAEYYSKNIKNNLETPFTPDKYLSSWAQYSILVSSRLERDLLMDKLSNNKIPNVIYYRIPLHLQKVYRYLGYKEGDFPVAETVSTNIFSIPMHPYLNKNQQNYIIEVLNKNNV